MSLHNCPICNFWNNVTFDLVEVGCPRCGDFIIHDREVIERALSLNEAGVAEYLRRGDSSDYEPGTALCIEVAKHAANGRGTDVPRSIISHVVRKRLDKRGP